METDAELVRRAIAGDNSAFDELAGRHRTRVCRLAMRRMGVWDSSQDIAQEAFVRAYLSLQSLRNPERFGAWVAGIAANLCKSYHRDLRETALPADALEVIRGIGAGDTEGDWIDRSTIHDALDRLPDGARDAALLCFVEEMKQSEIADLLGISLAAVKSRIREARTKLQKEMVYLVNGNFEGKEPGEEFGRALGQKLELARWYRELSDQMDSGVSIMNALASMCVQPFSPVLREATQKLMNQLTAGCTLSEALASINALVTPSVIGMVHAGETGGILAWTAGFIAERIELENGQQQLDLSFWCRTMGSVIAAGVSASHAAELSADVIHGKGLRQLSRELAKALDRRESIEPVIAKYEDVLPPAVRVVMSAGESTGVLGDALLWTANYLQSEMAGRLTGRRMLPPVPVEKWAFLLANAIAERVPGLPGAERASAVNVLSVLGSEGTIDCIKERLADADPQVRREAIDALARMGRAEASGSLIPLLDDSEPSVRRAAIHAIAELQIHRYARDIAQMIGDADQRVANSAITVLGRSGEAGALVDQAIVSAASEDARIRLRAVQILRDHPDRDSIEALVHLLYDREQRIGWTAAVALANLGRPEGIPALLESLEYQEQCGIQREAAQALAKVGNASHASGIRDAIKGGRLHESFVWAANELEERGQ